MKTHINGAFLGDLKAGLNIYGHEVVSRLLDVDDAHAILPKGLTDYPFSNIRSVPKSFSIDNGRRGILKRLLFFQRYSFKKGVFYSPIHEAPLYPCKGLKTVITIHDLIPLTYSKKHQLSYHYFKRVVPLLIQRATKVIAISKITKNDIINTYNVPDSKISVIPNGCDLSGLYPQNDLYRKQPYFLFVGNNREHKNIMRVLEAYLPFKGRLNLKVVGDMYDDENIDTFIEHHGLGDYVDFYQSIDMEKLRDLYANASALVFPSLYEGFGLPAIEAMACGCPVVTSKGSSMAEFCEDAALYVNPRNIDDISDKLEKVLSDDCYKEMCDKGLKYAEQMSWDVTAQKIKELISTVRDH